MNSFLLFQMNPLYIVFGCIGLAVILIVVLIIHSSKRKKKEALLRVAEDKLRESNLDRQILNPNAPEDLTRKVSEKPYEMRYSTTSTSVTRKGIMLQIEEVSEISKRKYMVNPVPAITIGSGSGNSIILTDMTIDAKQCELGLTDNNQVYVKNVGSTNSVSVLRGKKSLEVDANEFVLKKNDQLKIGSVKLTIHILKVA